MKFVVYSSHPHLLSREQSVLFAFILLLYNLYNNILVFRASLVFKLFPFHFNNRLITNTINLYQLQVHIPFITSSITNRNLKLYLRNDKAINKRWINICHSLLNSKFSISFAWLDHFSSKLYWTLAIFLYWVLITEEIVTFQLWQKHWNLIFSLFSCFRASWRSSL